MKIKATGTFHGKAFDAEALKALHDWCQQVEKDFAAFLKKGEKTRLATVREGWRELRQVGRCS